MKLDLIYTITSDSLRLPGILFSPNSQTDTCLIIVHGMSGHILENYWADILGRKLAENGTACLYGHNRGYGMISDPVMIDNHPDKYARFRAGAVYERFSGCIPDISAWISEAHKLGYSKIILLGQSLGGSKVIKYFSAQIPREVTAIILASPADMPGLARKDEANFESLLNEAKSNVSAGQPEKLLSRKLWDWYYLSSQTFVDLLEENGPADVLPVLRNPDKYPELASINVPLLVFYGQHDDSVILSNPQEDLDRIKSKSTTCPSFTSAIVPLANHDYDHHESEVADIILKWQTNL